MINLTSDYLRSSLRTPLVLPSHFEEPLRGQFHDPSGGLVRSTDHVKALQAEPTAGLEARGHISLSQIRGCTSLDQWPDPSDLEHANSIWSIGSLSSSKLYRSLQ